VNPATTLARSEQSRGSALLPMVAAMLILLLCGVALSEVFGSQRMQAVMHVEATRAIWIAEAGLWHAAHEETALTTAVSFGGGTYTVDRSGNDYSSTGAIEGATQRTTRTMLASQGPLDEAASVATVKIKGNKEFEMDLVSISTTDVIIQSFDLSADNNSYKAREFKLDHKRIWRENHGYSMPTGVTLLNQGHGHDRTIKAGDAPELRYRSYNKPSGTITYTLILYFTDGSSSTLGFSVAWDGDDDD
jgi:Tfp pilus assembly protein PilX